MMSVSSTPPQQTFTPEQLGFPKGSVPVYKSTVSSAPVYPELAGIRLSSQPIADQFVTQQSVINTITGEVLHEGGRLKSPIPTPNANALGVIKDAALKIGIPPQQVELLTALAQFPSQSSGLIEAHDVDHLASGAAANLIGEIHNTEFQKGIHTPEQLAGQTNASDLQKLVELSTKIATIITGGGENPIVSEEKTIGQALFQPPSIVTTTADLKGVSPLYENALKPAEEIVQQLKTSSVSAGVTEHMSDIRKTIASVAKTNPAGNWEVSWSDLPAYTAEKMSVLQQILEAGVKQSREGVFALVHPPQTVAEALKPDHFLHERANTLKALEFSVKSLIELVPQLLRR